MEIYHNKTAITPQDSLAESNTLSLEDQELIESIILLDGAPGPTILTALDGKDVEQRHAFIQGLIDIARQRDRMSTLAVALGTAIDIGGPESAAAIHQSFRVMYSSGTINNDDLKMLLDPRDHLAATDDRDVFYGDSARLLIATLGQSPDGALSDAVFETVIRFMEDGTHFPKDSHSDLLVDYAAGLHSIAENARKDGDSSKFYELIHFMYANEQFHKASIHGLSQEGKLSEFIDALTVLPPDENVSLIVFQPDEDWSPFGESGGLADRTETVWQGVLDLSREGQVELSEIERDAMAGYFNEHFDRLIEEMAQGTGTLHDQDNNDRFLFEDFASEILFKGTSTDAKSEAIKQIEEEVVNLATELNDFFMNGGDDGEMAAAAKKLAFVQASLVEGLEHRLAEINSEINSETSKDAQTLYNAGAAVLGVASFFLSGGFAAAAIGVGFAFLGPASEGLADSFNNSRYDEVAELLQDEKGDLTPKLRSDVPLNHNQRERSEKVAKELEDQFNNQRSARGLESR